MNDEAEIIETETEAQVPGLPETLNEAQKRMISGDTPDKYIKQRKARGGYQQDYVEIHYVRDQLNKIFGHNWDEQIIDKEFTNSGHIIVHVRLTARIGDEEVTKDGIGGEVITTFKDRDEPVDIGDDVKSAVADGLKKAASKFGIAQDVYWQDRPSDHGKNRDTLPDSNEKGDSDHKGRGNQEESDYSRYEREDGKIVRSPDNGDDALWRRLNGVMNDWAEELGMEAKAFREDFKVWLWEAKELEGEPSWSNLTPKRVDKLLSNMSSAVKAYKQDREI